MECGRVIIDILARRYPHSNATPGGPAKLIGVH